MDDITTLISGDPGSSILLIADHASNHVPDDVNLGVAPALLDTHIAIDLGVAALSAALCTQLGCPAILAGISRLVIDLNREEKDAELIPVISDGHAIPGNAPDLVSREIRLDRYWRPYHARVADQIARQQPRLLLSLHSFTPQLSSQPEQARPWEVGILYNDDDCAARIALPALEAAGVVVGDQLPYSGKDLNATMNRHGEGNGIAYLGLEMRQDLIGDAAGVAQWAALLVPVIRACAKDA